MFTVGVLPAIILGFGMFFLPKTPRWLMSKNREEEAKKVLQKIENKSNVDEDIENMKKSLSEESGGSYMLLLSPWLLPALIIGIGLMLIQQMTGINTVIYYAPTIFEMAGFKSAVASITATMSVGIINVLFTVVSIMLIDKLGRKPLLYIGLSGIILSLIVLGVAFEFTETLGESLKWIAVGSLLIYIASFAVSLGPICWLVISEIYPIKIRGFAMSIATFTNWAFNFLIALTFPILVNELLGVTATLSIYAVIGVIGLLFCFFYVPETKGHTLEEIEEHFFQRKPPRDLK